MCEQKQMKGIIKRIDFNELTPEMVDEIAEMVAKKLSNKNFPNKKSTMTQTQFRKFYEEVDILYRKLGQKSEDSFENAILPRIKMILPKIAYAKGRKTVSEDFYQLFNFSIREVNNEKQFRNFKYFIESVLGFFKMYTN